MGKMPVGRYTKYTATFKNVPYAPGKISAACYNHKGSTLGSTAYSTAGAVARLVLTADRSMIAASRDDLSFVTISAHDSKGVLVPDAAVQLTFKLDGDTVAEIAAVGNGDPQDVTSMQRSFRCVCAGCSSLVIVLERTVTSYT